MSEVHAPALHARFYRGLAASPRQPAIRVGSENITYEQANEKALEWAGALLARSDAPPAAIAVLADRGPTAYLGLLAALCTGAAVVPLQLDLPAGRIRHMLQASGVSVVLADERGCHLLTELGVNVPVLTISLESPQWKRHALSAPVAVKAADTAYILFTSGSTGRPKGMPITHGNLDYFFRLIDKRYDFTADDVLSQVLQLNFDCAIFELFAAWGAGATVCHVPFSAYQDMPAFFARHRLTVWFSTPSAISLIRRTGGLGTGSMPSLRWSFFAGEALKCSDAACWQEAASQSVIENLYGPAELTLTITGHRWSPQTSPRIGVNGVVPIGAVHPGHDYFLLADEQAKPGEGELCITGPQMTSGYLDPQDNVGRFIQRDSRTWYRTGDRVRRLPGGQLAYLGRNDSQVQIHGMRVELAEIEEAMRGCSGVEDAVTVAGLTGDELELVAFYTGASVPAAGLARQLRHVLYPAMIPRMFHHVDEFPLNPNRKIDRLKLTSVATDLLGSPEQIR